MINNLMYIELKRDILMMVRHGLDMSKFQKVRKQSILMTMPFRRISVTMQII